MKELRKIVSGFRAGILGVRSSVAMCCAVCLPLQGYLAIAGYETEFIDGEVCFDDGTVCGHVWLRLPDGRILDPTADQFEELGLPPVYIGALPPAYSETKSARGKVA